MFFFIIQGLLGLKGGSGAGFLETILSVCNNLDKIKVGDMILGFTSIVILLLLRVSNHFFYCFIK